MNAEFVVFVSVRCMKKAGNAAESRSRPAAVAGLPHHGPCQSFLRDVSSSNQTAPLTPPDIATASHLFHLHNTCTAVAASSDSAPTSHARHPYPYSLPRPLHRYRGGAALPYLIAHTTPPPPPYRESRTIRQDGAEKVAAGDGQGQAPAPLTAFPPRRTLTRRAGVQASR